MKAQLAKLILIALALGVINAGATTRYVDLNSPSPTPPYTSWPTAATNIQDAIDAAVAGDLVLVTNGVYNAGGRAIGMMTNRIAINKAITVQSVNGPSVTAVRGYQMPGTKNGNQAVRCAYLANNAVLVGFTLSDGATRNIGDPSGEYYGGGLWCESLNATVSNCVFSNNWAGLSGGGVYRGTLTNCLLISNSVPISPAAGFAGGGASGSVLSNCFLTGNNAERGGGSTSSTLYNCTISANQAGNGGGTASGVLYNCLIVQNLASNNGGGASGGNFYNCTIVNNVAANRGGGVEAGTGAGLYNCIAYFNSAPSGSNTFGAFCDYSCTSTPFFGGFCITNPPAFADLASGDYHLQSNSPCINASANTYTTGSATDLDGNPRIVGGTVDMGAYEFQSPASVLSYAWAQQYGLPTDGSADLTDLDGDGMNNYGEWRSDTIPTNTLSVLRMVNATNSPTGAKVTWQSVATRNYWVERATNFSGALPFSTIASNLAGVAGTKTYTDASATNGGPYFYRVGVQ